MSEKDLAKRLATAREKAKVRATEWETA